MGCGTGAITSKLNLERLYGVDNNKQLVNIARKKGLKTYFSDIEELPFKKEFFDVIISIDSIEHVESREKTMKEIKRVLKKNGKVVIFTPAYDSPTWVLGEKFANFITNRKSGHISPFTKESLNHYLKNNFRHIKIKRINFGLGLVAIADKKK